MTHGNHLSLFLLVPYPSTDFSLYSQPRTPEFKTGRETYRQTHTNRERERERRTDTKHTHTHKQRERRTDRHTQTERGKKNAI